MKTQPPCRRDSLEIRGISTATCATLFPENNISVNTSSVSGTAGSVELQFNPVDSTSLAATATSIPQREQRHPGTIDTPIGDASGDLGSTVTIQNGQGTNDFFQNYTYGSTLSFTLAFSGTALSSPVPSTSGSTFFLTLWDSQTSVVDSGSGSPLFVGEPDSEPAAGHPAPNGDGTETIENAGPGVSATPSVLVPEPSTLVVGVSGGLAMLAVGLWRRRHVRPAGTTAKSVAGWAAAEPREPGYRS